METGQVPYMEFSSLDLGEDMQYELIQTTKTTESEGLPMAL